VPLAPSSKSATAGNKIDYVLLSPALFAQTVRGGIFRKGMWPGVRPPRWPSYPEITKEAEAASDHGAIWADIDL
jgi:exonuclease III